MPSHKQVAFVVVASLGIAYLALFEVVSRKLEESSPSTKASVIRATVDAFNFAKVIQTAASTLFKTLMKHPTKVSKALEKAIKAVELVQHVKI